MISNAVEWGATNKPIPPGCEDAPGYILDVFDGLAWMTQDGKVTTNWAERGVWLTLEEVKAARERFWPGGDDL